ncbi:hypothetical protein CN109_08350 [Sinorhizobium meliloti]|nr:hypothetical protein CN109_08350 [Sinorhizobium meliloti]
MCRDCNDLNSTVLVSLLQLYQGEHRPHTRSTPGCTKFQGCTLCRAGSSQGAHHVPSPALRAQAADSDEAAPLFRDDCAPGFRDDLAPCLVGSAGDDCCQFIQARCQALRGRFRRRLSPLNSMRWALWTNLSSMASA